MARKGGPSSRSSALKLTAVWRGVAGRQIARDYELIRRACTGSEPMA